MRTEPFWIEGPWTGRLAILLRPRGGDWLEDEVRSWRHAGLDAVVSVLTPDEIANFDLVHEADLCEATGIQFFSFPIVDRGTPSSRQATSSFVESLEEYLADGKKIGIHCRQGIGRSALMAACLLALAGVSTEEAFQRVSAARGSHVPETPEQRKWVAEFAHDLRSQPR
jgi:protein-tyrosine phosphatase